MKLEWQIMSKIDASAETANWQNMQVSDFKAKVANWEKELDNSVPEEYKNLRQEVVAAYKEVVSIYAEKYGVDENLVFAVIKAESNFDENAVSHREAIGIFSKLDNGWPAGKTARSLSRAKRIVSNSGLVGSRRKPQSTRPCKIHSSISV